MKLLLVLFHLFIPSLSIDSVEGFIRNVLLTARDMGERALYSLHIPTSNDVVNNPGIAFSLDDKSAYAIKSLGEYFNTCPPSIPAPILSGSWHVTHVSKKWAQTVLADLDEDINLLANGQPLPVRKSLASVLRGEPQISCMKMEFLDDNAASRFEVSYLKDGEKRSVIGDLFRRPDRSLELAIASSFNTKMIVSYSMDHSSPSPLDVMVLSQIDFFPKCENYVILQRSMDSTRILQILTAIGANFPSNPLVHIRCEQVPQGNNAIIKPLSMIKPL
ncbi:unnamed protein product [Cylicocyclus nassatus]|uniref:Uncharacterized protein n=1 Tax=Cylicocyclus nassatus TaxID=53992 RepID=A0AA36DR76_CYLNA|nr:unnamed protein product [Cylicocyclus nassatus]